MMKRHHQFGWDTGKAKSNVQKHRVTFHDAAAVLSDDQAEKHHLEKPDDKHSMREDRFITIGSHPMNRKLVLFIVWTERRKRGNITPGSSAHDARPPRKRANMPKQSETGKLVTIAANELPAPTPEDMARLEAAMDIPVEPGEDDEFPWDGPEVQRDASGKIPRQPLGQLRTAILASLSYHKMTRYELWKKANAYCSTLTASAVYEYLRGTREIKSEYVEALMKAAMLKVVKQGGSSSSKVGPKKGTQSKSTADGEGTPSRLVRSTQAGAVAARPSRRPSDDGASVAEPMPSRRMRPDRPALVRPRVDGSGGH